MLFCQRRGAQAVKGLRAKNTLFVAKRRKGRFFPKQPEGLDLDGQAERANFAAFFEFLNQQHFFARRSRRKRRNWTSTVLPKKDLAR